MAKVYITSGTSWAGVATDGSNIVIECIGAGGAGGLGTGNNTTPGGGGGGGGEYAKVTVAYTSESSISGIQIGQGKTPGNDSTETHWNTNVCIAKPGQKGSRPSGGAGGTGGTGDTKYNGGAGEDGGSYGGGGGGGAAGLNGVGGGGGYVGSTGYGGGGGGGNGGGDGGQGSPEGAAGGAGASGGGNGGACGSSGQAGTNLGSSYGSGGGGGGNGANRFSAGNGGNYGGGGGGGSGYNGHPEAGNGANGIICITYTEIITPTISVSDSLSSSESIETLLTNNISIYEQCSITENNQFYTLLNISSYEECSVIENLDLSEEIVLSTQDSLSINENLNTILSSDISVYDSSLVQEGYSNYTDLYLITSDQIVVGEYTSFYYFIPSMYGTMIYGCALYGGYYLMDKFLLVNTSDDISSSEDLVIDPISIELNSYDDVSILEEVNQNIESYIDVGDNIVVFDSPNMPIMIFLNEFIGIGENIESVAWGQEIDVNDSASCSDNLLIDSTFNVDSVDDIAVDQVIIDSVSSLADIIVFNNASCYDVASIDPLEIELNINNNISLSEYVNGVVPIDAIINDSLSVIQVLNDIDLELGTISMIDNISVSENILQYLSVDVNKYDTISLLDLSTQMDSMRMAPDVESPRAIQSFK